ncbi:alpha/beta fold hydrolase [Moheibacter sediminis]|uniref:Pimeloyl-ACP methyl ester carboxylesterase n=1 Tax=Moheibacter sediminis TaxID=1434700 RepID=A0A1W2C7J5_9FLAO|nr:alpha/beta hydrolase [Moheibacter sediminis]SMC81110.1 Pimeloyl-ACP methyl ester carboxylesterase [Moheibacter sediminis]
MLNYEEKGEGRAVVLLHGYLENLRMWKSIGNELSKIYKVVKIDLPGHGKSKTYGKIHTMEFMAEKVNAVLDELKIEDPILIGHSMGGYVTLAFTELFPKKLKGFILLNSTSLPDSEEKKEQRLKAVETAQRNFDALVKMSIPNLFAEKKREFLKEEMEFAKELARETPIEGVTAALLGMRERPDRTNVLLSFKGAKGLVMGKYDQAVNPEELKKIIPEESNILVTELEAAHMAHLEVPEHTLNFLFDFLSDVWE